MSGTVRVKKLTCRACGGPKVTPVRTAYVYCDYCGSLTDWDFHTANGTAGSARPDPQYEALYLYLKPALSEALWRGDRDAYARAQRQLFDVHVRTCPAAYSPRVGDPAYRAAIIEYLTGTRVVTDFDPAQAHLAQEVDRAEQTMRWVESAGRSLARADRFWNLFRAWHAQHTTALAACDRAGVVRLHPDGAPLDLLLRIDASAFVQKWLPLLSPEDAAAVLAHTGLAAQYVEQPAPVTTARHCGACGAGIDAPVGARRVLCFGCGHLIDVSAPEIPCHHCGSPISVPPGARMVACKSCRSRAQLV